MSPELFLRTVDGKMLTFSAVVSLREQPRFLYAVGMQAVDKAASLTIREEGGYLTWIWVGP